MVESTPSDYNMLPNSRATALGNTPQGACQPQYQFTATSIVLEVGEEEKEEELEIFRI